MLVLNRSVGETICITENNLTVRLTVIGHKHGSVQLGVEAPKEVLIRRSELVEPERQPEHE